MLFRHHSTKEKKNGRNRSASSSIEVGADVLGHARIPNNGSPFGVTEGDQSRVTLVPSLFAPHSPALRLTAESMITLKAG